MNSKTLLQVAGLVSLVALAACSANGPTNPDCAWDPDTNQSFCSAPAETPSILPRAK
jgi:hypothetical protein